MDRVTKSFNEALAALNNRDFTRAEERFRKVIQADPSHVPALNLLTVVLMGLGRFADAERFIARAVALNRKSDVSFYNYGVISKEFGKHQQAHEQFSEALKLNPNVPETWNNRGTASNGLHVAGLTDDQAAARSADLPSTSWLISTGSPAPRERAFWGIDPPPSRSTISVIPEPWVRLSSTTSSLTRTSSPGTTSHSTGRRSSGCRIRTRRTIANGKSRTEH